MKPFKHPLPQAFFTFLPLLLSISVLASFFTQYPKVAIDLLDQALKKAGLIRLSTLPNNDPSSITFTASTPTSPNPNKNEPLYVPATKINYYTGVELWQEIQRYRRQHGVPEFQQDNVLCTIASIRVNQLLTLETLDDHNGFSPEVEKFRENDQLTHHNVAENILSGYPTAPEAIQGWDSSLGHQSLMQDGSYVYACTAANSGFAVLIAAY